MSVDGFGEMDSYTGSLMQEHFEREQQLLREQQIAEVLRSDSFTAVQFEEEAQDPQLVIGEESMRQLRIAGGDEPSCRVCGCSESRACEGGCLWATKTLCSRCALEESAKGAAGG